MNWCQTFFSHIGSSNSWNIQWLQEQVGIRRRYYNNTEVHLMFLQSKQFYSFFIELLGEIVLFTLHNFCASVHLTLSHDLNLKVDFLFQSIHYFLNEKRWVFLMKCLAVLVLINLSITIILVSLSHKNIVGTGTPSPLHYKNTWFHGFQYLF